MHCGACVVALTQVLMEVPGSKDARVHFGSKTATVITMEDVSDESYFKAVESAGYHAVFPVDLQTAGGVSFGRWKVIAWVAATATIFVVLIVLYNWT